MQVPRKTTALGTLAKAAYRRPHISGVTRLVSMPGTRIEDGTIIGTDKIAPETISGDLLVEGTVEADRLNVDKLSAIAADLGTITTGTITGATFQTSASNPRVIMDDEGLRRFDGEGNADFTLDDEGLEITEGTIIGATFQTSAEGARVVIDSDGIRGINAAAEEQFNFDTASGILTATAVISSLTGSAIDTEHLAGQITETQIEDDSISTPKLQANIIEGKHLAVETLGALKADLGTINAGTLTGTTVRTAAEKARTQLDGQGFRQFDDEENVLTHIPADGSEASFTGELYAKGLRLDVGAGVGQTIKWDDAEDVQQHYILGFPTSAGQSGLLAEAGFFGQSEQTFIELRASDDNAGTAVINLQAYSGKGTPYGDIRMNVPGPGASDITYTLLDGERRSAFLQLLSAETGGSKRTINYGVTNISDGGGNNSIEQDISHGLGVTPKVVIVTPATGAFQIHATAAVYTESKFRAYAYRHDANISSVDIAWIAIG